MNKIINLTILGFVLSFCSASASSKHLLDSEDSQRLEAKTATKINMSEQTAGKPLVVTLESKNIFMRSINEDRGDLDYYFQIFSNKITMEKYMQGIPRPSDEIIKRHQKYFSWWENGNPYSSYLTFLNEDAARKFLQEQEKLEELFDTFFKSFPSEKIPLKHETSKGTKILLKALRKEFEDTKKIFIGHVLLEPGDDRELRTDAEVSYVFLPSFWSKGYATEAVSNIVELANVCRQKKITLDGYHIDTLIATARPDNPGSCRVLEKNGFTIYKEEEKFGALRRLYTLGL